MLDWIKPLKWGLSVERRKKTKVVHSSTNAHLKKAVLVSTGDVSTTISRANQGVRRERVLYRHIVGPFLS